MKALLATVLLPVLASAQHTDWLGMTPAQVEKMGRREFTDAFSIRHGSSTAAMCDSEVSYGAAIRALNDAYAGKHSPRNAAVVERVRPLAERFLVLTTDVGYAFSGGGTMWNPVYAGIRADVEEIVAQLYGRTKLGPGGSQAEVWKTLLSTEQIVKDTAKEMDEPHLPDRRPSEDAMKALHGMRSLFFEIVQETASLPAAERKAVYGSLLSDLEASLDMAGVGCQ